MMNIMIFEDLQADVEQLESLIVKNYPRLPIFYSQDIEKITDYIENEEDFTLYFLDIFIGKEPLGLEIAQKIINKTMA